MSQRDLETIDLGVRLEYLYILEAIASTEVDTIPGGIMQREGPFEHIHTLLLGTPRLAPTNHHMTKQYCDVIWNALNAFGDNK